MAKSYNEFLVCRKHRDETAKMSGKKFRKFWLGVMDYALDGKTPEFMEDKSDDLKELRELFPRVKTYIDKKREKYDWNQYVNSKTV